MRLFLILLLTTALYAGDGIKYEFYGSGKIYPVELRKEIADIRLNLKSNTDNISSIQIATGTINTSLAETKVATGTINTALTSEIASRVALAVSTGPTVTLQSDIYIYGTTLADVTGLSFSLTANTTYAYKFYVIWQSTKTTDGIAISMNGPTEVYTLYHITIMSDVWSATTSNIFGRTWDEATATTSIDTADVNCIAIIEGKCCCSAAGTLIVRVASENASGKITVKQGSGGRLERY